MCVEGALLVKLDAPRNTDLPTQRSKADRDGARGRSTDIAVPIEYAETQLEATVKGGSPQLVTNATSEDQRGTKASSLFVGTHPPFGLPALFLSQRMAVPVSV